jgi:hypothetical protein
VFIVCTIADILECRTSTKVEHRQSKGFRFAYLQDGDAGWTCDCVTEGIPSPRLILRASHVDGAVATEARPRRTQITFNVPSEQGIITT